MEKKSSLRPLSKTVCFCGILFSFVSVSQLLNYVIRHSGGFYLCNSGISFGIRVPNIFFWLVFAIFLLALVVFLYKKRSFSDVFVVGLALSGGGALSNATDRLLFGCVLDYIPLFKKAPVFFNVADVGIFLGTCLIFFALLEKTVGRSE